MARKATRAELLAEYARMVLTDPSAAYRLGVEANLRPKDMVAARDLAMIRQATEFHVVRYLGRDPREDRGVVTQPLYEVVEGLSTLAEARAVAARQGSDQHGRRSLVRAIVGGCPVGIVVPEGLEP
jgi:hypothetical protein